MKSQASVRKKNGRAAPSGSAATAALQQYRTAVEAQVPLLDPLDEAVALLLPTGEIAYANEAFGQLLGQRPEAIFSKKIQKLLSGALSRLLSEYLENPGSPLRFESVSLRTAGRTTVPVAVSADRLRVGGLSAIYLRLANLEAECRFEEAIFSGRLNRSIFHNACEAIVVCTPQGKILRASQAAVTLAGLMPVGRTVGEAFPIKLLDRETQSRRDPWDGPHSLLSVLSDRGFFRTVEAELRPKVRPARRLLVSGRTVAEPSGGRQGLSGGRLVFLIVMTDITAVREAEAAQRVSDERYRGLIDAAPDAILMESQGKIVYANPAAGRLLRVPPEELKRESIANYLDPAERRRFLDLVRESVRQGAPCRLDEERLVLPGGLTLNVEVTILAVPGAEPATVQMILRDVTEKKLAEEKVLELNTVLERRVAERTAQLHEAMRDLNGFAYSVAHDLRAPLRAMQGFSRVLLEDYGDRLDDPGRDFAHRIVEASLRMDSLISDLLAYSRVSREDLLLDPVDLNLAIEDALAQLEGQARERNADVEVDRPLPWVKGHPLTLTQVILNLISNALKFVAPGVRPRVRVRAEAAAGLARVWVEDNGIGIAPEHHARIFKVFERLHRREVYPGTGMGLAIVQRAMERMGGRVGLESAPGQGSRFWIELPVASPP